MGFEPMHRGFADPCLTTWLRRRAAISLAQDVCSGKRNQFASHYDGASRRLIFSPPSVISRVAVAVVGVWVLDPDSHS
jgi:hypothetical protein